jgi:hypothetical protein
VSAETKHSPEPWRVIADYAAMDAYGGQTCIASGGDGGAVNARRIVACVNACAGLSTEALEAGALGRALRLLEGIAPATAEVCALKR